MKWVCVCLEGREGGGGGMGGGEVEKAPKNSPKQMKLYLVSCNSYVSVNLRSLTGIKLTYIYAGLVEIP